MAETTIRKLLVRLGVKADQKRLAKFDKGLAGVKRNMKALAVGSLAVTAALTKIVLDTARAGDTAIKTADKLGMEVEALQEIEFAASKAGVETNTLRMAIQRMTRRMSEAAMDTGEAKDAIKELGLNAKKMAALKPEEALMEVAGAMVQVEKRSDRLRLSFKLFDSEGVALINLLNKGKIGIQQFRDEAKALGLVMSRDDTEAAATFQDSLVAVKGVMTGIRNTIGLSLMPEVTRMLTKFRDWSMVNKELIKQRTNEWAEGIADGFERVTEMGGRVDDVVQSLGGWERILKTIAVIGAIAATAMFIAPFISMIIALAGIIAAGTTAIAVLFALVGVVSALAAGVIGLVALAAIIQDIWFGLKGFDSVTLRFIRRIRDLQFWVSTGDSWLRRMLVTVEALGGRFSWLATMARGFFDVVSKIARFGFGIVGFDKAIGAPLSAPPVAPPMGNQTVTIGGNTFHIRGGVTTPMDIARQVDDVMAQRNRAAADAISESRER